MIVSVDEFNAYTNDYNNENTSVKELVIGAAQNIVEQYLGYRLDFSPAEDYGMMNNNDFIPVSELVSAIESIKINDNELTADDIKKVHKNYITLKNNYSGFIKVEYYTGYMKPGTIIPLLLWNSNATVPDAIKLAILQIASLKYMETGKRIGVTGLNTPDGVGTTFVNYTNFDKWLKAVAPYRIL